IRCGIRCGTGEATVSRMALGLAMALALCMAACKNPQVGRECILPGLGDAGVTQTVVGSPALECPARTCIHVAGGAADLCTAEWGSDDECEAFDQPPCTMGFVCPVPVVVGPFCCKKFCVCKDYQPTAEVPAACDENNAANECCNLAGRRGDPKYPLCK